MTRQPRTIEQRLAPSRGDPKECWTGPWKPEKTGYVRAWLHPHEREPGRRGEFDLVHRIAYRLWIGPIGGGLQVDHLCGNRACFNPAHLEAVPPQENNRRSASPSAKNARKTHCKRGHEFTPENTLLRPLRTDRPPVRVCRTCERDRQRITDADQQAILAARYRADIEEGLRDGPRKAVPTHCRQGHAYDSENTYFYIGTKRRSDGTLSVQRKCRECQQEWQRRYESDPDKYRAKQERRNERRRAAYEANKARMSA